MEPRWEYSQYRVHCFGAIYDYTLLLRDIGQLFLGILEVQVRLHFFVDTELRLDFTSCVFLSTATQVPNSRLLRALKGSSILYSRSLEG